MPIFKVNAGKLKKLNAIPLAKEKNLQQLLEAILMEVLERVFWQPSTPPPLAAASIPWPSIPMARPSSLNTNATRTTMSSIRRCPI
jgi:hypothetical protein